MGPRHVLQILFCKKSKIANNSIAKGREKKNRPLIFLESSEFYKKLCLVSKFKNNQSLRNKISSNNLVMYWVKHPQFLQDQF